jgi:hypothetical protein
VEPLPLRNSGATRAYAFCTKVGLRQPLWPSRKPLAMKGRRRVGQGELAVESHRLLACHAKCLRFNSFPVMKHTASAAGRINGG